MGRLIKGLGVDIPCDDFKIQVWLILGLGAICDVKKIPSPRDVETKHHRTHFRICATIRSSSTQNLSSRDTASLLSGSEFFSRHRLYGIQIWCLWLLCCFLFAVIRMELHYRIRDKRTYARTVGSWIRRHCEQGAEVERIHN